MTEVNSLSVKDLLFVCFVVVVFVFFVFFKFILFMAVLGLRFCARALSSCGKRSAWIDILLSVNHQDNKTLVEIGRAHV